MCIRDSRNRLNRQLQACTSVRPGQNAQEYDDFNRSRCEAERDDEIPAHAAAGLERVEMMHIKSCKTNERGSTLVEFAIGATVFLTAMFAVLEFGRALWTHNALTDAARRGARYATMHASADSGSVQNVVVYGNEAGSGSPILPNLTTVS